MDALGCSFFSSNRRLGSRAREQNNYAEFSRFPRILVLVHAAGAKPSESSGRIRDKASGKNSVRDSLTEDKVVFELKLRDLKKNSSLSGKPGSSSQKNSDSEEERKRYTSQTVPDSKVYLPSPSRGELFFQEQKSRAAAAVEKEKKKKKKKPPVLKSLEPCCYGCGAPLQYTEESAPGFVPEEKFMLKKKHHQLGLVLCTRCQSMCHGKLIPAVGGYGLYGKEKGFVTADQLRKQLAHIREERALVVKLVDIVDFSGSFITRLRDLVGANPIVLVATKVDLLPEGTNLAAVGDWIIEATLRKKLNVISVHLTSAKSLLGITTIVKEIQRERQGRDVYVLGAANVGKSALISALLKEMASRDPVAAVAKRFNPVQSVLPGTTLGPISIKAFSSGGSLYDTPGVHVHHRIETTVSPDDLPLLFPPRRLRGYLVSPVLERKGAEQIFGVNSKEEMRLRSLCGATLFWGGLARVDIFKAPLNVRLTFYGSSSLRVHKVPTKEADQFYTDELGKTLVPPTGADKADVWPGLAHCRKFSLAYNTSRPAGDVAISGLGWISIEFLEKDGIEPPEELDGCLELEVRVPRGIETFLRPSIPVGSTGSQWYTFQELGEDEEKARPRLYYPAEHAW